MAFQGVVNYRFAFSCQPDGEKSDCWLTGDSLCCEDGLACAFQGCLLNRKELCESQHLPVQTRPEELLAHLYRKEAEKFVKRLNGRFVFAIWDPARHWLLLARDQIGQEVLYVARLGGGAVAFSTDLNRLRQYPGVSSQVSLKGLMDYLSLGYIPSPHTFYRGIEKLRAGHQLVVAGTGVTEDAYWQPCLGTRKKVDIHEAVAEGWRLLDIAVKRCLEERSGANVMVSGGIDSNLVLSLAATSEGFGKHAFTVGFEDSAYDERVLAALMPAKYQVSHVQRTVSPDWLPRLEAAQKANGEPFGDSSLIPTWCAMDLSREAESQTVLMGSGGDEIFGGYRRYQALALRHSCRWLPQWLVRGVSGMLLKILGEPKDSRARFATCRRMAAFWRQSPLAGFASFQEVFSENLKNELLSDWTHGGWTAYLEDWMETVKTFGTRDVVEQCNWLDVISYLPDDGCHKESLAAKMAGVSALSPILDLDVVEYGLSLPRNLKTTSRKRKRVLHGIGSFLLAPELLRQGKKGFGMPVSGWMRTSCADLIRELAADAARWDRHGWFEPTVVQRLVDEHLAGTHDHGAQLWILLCLKTLL